MKKKFLTLLAFLLWGLSSSLQAQEQKVNVKARLPGVDVEFKSNPTPAPQPAQPVQPVLVVEKQTVVTEPEKKGCSCNMIPTTTSGQAVLSMAIFLTAGLIPRWLRNRNSTENL